MLLKGKREILGQHVAVMGVRKGDGEYVIVVSSEETETILSDYALRWKIETMFGCLKTRGFNLESTHVKEKERLEKLVALLAIAYCWAFIIGEWIAKLEPLKVKKHGRLSKSVFRRGLDYLRRILCNQDGEHERSIFIKLCQLLSRT